MSSDFLLLLWCLSVLSPQALSVLTRYFRETRNEAWDISRSRWFCASSPWLRREGFIWELLREASVIKNRGIPSPDEAKVCISAAVLAFKSFQKHVGGDSRSDSSKNGIFIITAFISSTDNVQMLPNFGIFSFFSPLIQFIFFFFNIGTIIITSPGLACSLWTNSIFRLNWTFYRLFFFFSFLFFCIFLLDDLDLALV